jgi:hypothetical protein
MTLGLNRASSLAFKTEVTAGEYLEPTSGAEFVPLRPKSEIKYEPESLASDELLNDIGEAKAAVGKEKVSGSHAAYVRHSGVEGQEPEVGILYESILGSKHVMGTEYDTVSSSTTSIVKVNTGEGASFTAGQALLLKNSAGYEMRNIASISGDNLTVNFALNNAPASGVNLGKAVTYKPAATGHPTFSITKYVGGGFAKEASAGNTTTEASFKLEANKFGEVDFSFEGTKYYYNPIIITSSNKYLDLTDDEGTTFVAITEGIYKTPIALADAIQVALDALNIETYTCTFSNTTGKFTIASGSVALSLLFNTGANVANSIGPTIGFSAASNKTGAVTYTSDNAQSYAASLTPSYDTADAIVLKGADLFIGNSSDNVCVCAQSVSLKLSKKTEDVEAICEENGILEKIATSRTVEMTVSAAVKKHDVALLDSLLKNTTISAMLNAGPKVGGNWVAGKCFNLYLQNCTVSSHSFKGDSFTAVELTLKGFVTSSSKDLYVNFV